MKENVSKIKPNFAGNFKKTIPILFNHPPSCLERRERKTHHERTENGFHFEMNTHHAKASRTLKI